MQKSSFRFWELIFESALSARVSQKNFASAAISFLCLLASSNIHARSAEVKPETIVSRSLVEGQADATKVLSQKAESDITSFLECYKAELKENNGAVGELHTEITISPKGIIIGVNSLDTTTISENLKGCSIKVLKGWKLESWPISNQVLAVFNLNFRLLSKAPDGTVVTGGLKKNVVAGIFNARSREFDACIKSPPEKMTRLISTVNIAFNGRVKRANVSGRGVSQKARKCMAAKILSWRFPSSHVGHRTYVQYPLFFIPPEPEKQSKEPLLSDSSGKQENRN